MPETRYRKSTHVLTHLIIISLVASLPAGGLHSLAAEKADTTQDETRGRRVVEIEIGDEGVIVQPSAEGKEKKGRISAGIVIDDEGIMVNGVCIESHELDSVVKRIAIEGGSIVKFGEDIIVEENEIVDGDLVAFGGDVTVRGTVTGDVALIGGDLYLESMGTIKGDVHTIGGEIHQEPGSEIRGQRVGIKHFGALPTHFRFYGPPFFIWHPIRPFLGFGVILAFFIIISLLLAALALFFAPHQVERIRAAIEEAPLKSVLLGFVAAILFLPLFVLLCITIVGIPVALVVQPIAYSVAGIMGFAGVSLFVGAKLDRSSGLTLSSPLAKMVVGALVIELAFILAWIFTLGGGLLAPLFWLFQLIGWIIIAVAAMAGLGAAVWTRFGRRSVVGPLAPAPQAPPPPSPVDEGNKDAPATPAPGR